ncbi:MAG: glycosyltransferase [Chloroflexi bacterium]|nr:glycosyltransferase [Chloroflexota bacterium]
MNPRVAIVHDYLVDSGGAERVVIALHEQFPDAPIFTSVIDRQTTFPVFNLMDVRTSFLQRLPVRKSNYKLLLPFFPVAFESFDLSDYDVVVSSASGFAKGVVTSSDTLHVCYCHTPSRFAWRFHEYVAQEQMGRVKRSIVQLIVHFLRQWDYVAAQRVDYFIANSQTTAQRIQKNYRRESVVIHPPIDVESFSICGDIGDYYLVVSRLAPYKRIDLVVQAFNELALPLKIVGAGVDAQRLRALAKPNVEFLGHVPQNQLSELYARSRAVIFPGVEDFGLVPLEANAAGRPVIAFAAGGALETIIDGVTGRFFNESTSDALMAAVRETDIHSFDAGAMRAHAERFSKTQFQKQIADFIGEKWQSFGPP